MPYLQSQSLESMDLEIITTTPQRGSAKSSSNLFTMLPGAVKHRLSTIPLLKKSFSSYNVNSNRQSLLVNGNRPRSVDFSSLQLYTKDSERAVSKDIVTEARTGTFEEDSRTSWKYVNQGLTLLGTAVVESQCPDRENQAFARQLYVHALIYLLHGLPTDLTEVEAVTLQKSLPPMLQSGSAKVDTSERLGRTSKSLLHRLLASGIVQLFILFSFILPYIKLTMRSAYSYERSYHISERVFAAVLNLLDSLGRRGISIAGIILYSGNGKVGGILVGSFAWWINSISGGIHDGIGEGMALMGGQRPGSEHFR